MIIRLLAGAALVAMLPVCAAAAQENRVNAVNAVSASAATPQATGVFAQKSALPFHAPDFTRIADADLQPAIEQGIAVNLAEIEAIANNPAPPTFDNTLVAMERTGAMLGRAYRVLGQLTSANTNEALDAAQAAVAPKLSAMQDAIVLNDKLFQRVKAVYDGRAAMSMTPEDAMLLETTYAYFVHAGALLTPAQKAEVTKLNTRLAELQTAFSQKLTEATDAKAPVFDSREELAGLTEAQIAAAAKLAEDKGLPGKYVVALINTTQQPALAQLTSRDSRRKLFEASVNRTSGGDEYDTTALVAEIAELRAQKAALLGQPSFADFAMYNRMVKKPAEAIEFMERFVPAVAATQDRERGMLEDFARSQGRRSRSSRGTGAITPSRCARRATTWTKTRSSRTSRSGARSRTACSSPPRSSTASASSAAPTSRPTTPTCASTRCLTRTAASSRCSTPTRSRGRTSRAARGWATSSSSRTCSATSR